MLCSGVVMQFGINGRRKEMNPGFFADSVSVMLVSVPWVFDSFSSFSDDAGMDL